MKVYKLMEMLSKQDPNADVKLHDYNGDVVLNALARANDPKTVWLECEDDFDVGTELRAMIETAMEEGWSDQDYFTELWSLGYTPEIYGWYMRTDVNTNGKENADWLRMMYEEWGLV